VNFGGCLQESGREQEALRNYERALAIYKKSLGDGHERTRDVEIRMAAVYRTLGRDADALRFERSTSVVQMSRSSR